MGKLLLHKRNRVIAAVTVMALVGGLVVPLPSSRANYFSATSSDRLSGEISLNPQVHYQTLDGWGSSITWWGNTIGTWGNRDFNGNGIPDREEIAKLAFSPEELNLNIIRYNVGGGDKEKTTIKRIEGLVPGWSKDMYGSADGGDLVVQDDFWNMQLEEMSDHGQLWMLDQANAIRKEAAAVNGTENDIINEVFSNSPPYYMTNSGSSTGNTNASLDNLKTAYEAAFANYLATATKWIDNYLSAKYGTGVDFLVPMNEPNSSYWKDGSTKQEGNHVSAGTSQSKMFVDAAKALNDLDLENVKLTGTDETSLSVGISSWKSLSNEAKKLIDTISVHTYGSSSADRISLRDLSAQYNTGLWMSEVCKGGSPHGSNTVSTSGSISQSQGIMSDLRDMKSTAWIAWLVADSEYESLTWNENWGLIHAVFEEDGPVADYHKNLFDENGVVLDNIPSYGYWHITKQFYTMKQYSKYLKSGYTLIDIGDSNMVAAISPDADQLVIVAQNFSNDRKTTIDLNAFKNLSTAQLYRTSDNEDCALVGTLDVSKGVLNVMLPKNSISTYVISANNGGSLNDGGYYNIINTDVTTLSNAADVGADDMNKFTLDSKWTKTTLSGAYSGNVQRATADGATAIFKFEGDGGIITGQKSTSGSEFKVYVDNEEKGTFTSYSVTSNADAILFDTGELSEGTHEVKLVKSGSTGSLSIGSARIVTGTVDFTQILRLNVIAGHDKTLTIEFNEFDTATAYKIYCGTDENSLQEYKEVATAGAVSITGLENGTTYYVMVSAVTPDGEVDSKIVSGIPNLPEEANLYYFVNPGISSNYLLESGESFGRFSSSLDQQYIEDPVTGKTWGYDNENSISDISTGDLWSGVRFDDNDTVGKGLTYKFELEPGTYSVTLGFYDPWANSSRYQDIIVQGETKDSALVPGQKKLQRSYSAMVGEDGTLTVDIVRSSGNTNQYNDVMLSFILVEEYDSSKVSHIVAPEDMAVPVGSYPVLPAAIKVVTIDGETLEYGIQWDYSNYPKFANAKAYDVITLTGTVKGLSSDTEIKVSVLPLGMTYLIDCNKTTSVIHNMLLDYVDLGNRVPDQAYNGTWGYVGSYGKYDSSNTDLYSSGWYALNAGDMGYKVQLKAGTYTATLGVKEWWGNQSRRMSFYAEVGAQNSDIFKLLSTGSVSIGPTASETATTATSFTLTNDAEVSLTVKKNGSNDSVMSWISIQKDTTVSEETQEMFNRYGALKASDWSFETWKNVLSALNELNQALLAGKDGETITFLTLALGNTIDNLKSGESEVIDLTGLESSIADAKELLENEKYTIDSRMALSGLISKIEDEMADYKTQSEVNSAILSLAAAVANLELVSGKDLQEMTLDELIIKGQEELAKTEIYTAKTLEELEDAVTGAQAVIGSPYPTIVESARQDLIAAIRGLERLPVPGTPAIDKLKELFIEARLLAETEGTYTQSSRQVLADFLDEIESFLDDSIPDDVIDAMIKAINDLIEALVPESPIVIIDKSALLKVIGDAEELSSDDYTVGSWENLQTMLIDAKEIYANETNDQMLVDVTVEELQGLIDDLVDLRELRAAIARETGLVSGDYTLLSWYSAQILLYDAKAILAKSNAAAAEVKAAADVLNIAFDNLVVKVNKSKLKNVIDETATYNTSFYTTLSVLKMKLALNDAQKVYNGAGYSQPEVDAAELALKNAIAALVPQINRTELKALITSTSAISSSNYTFVSWYYLRLAISEATAVANDVNATQEQVNEQVSLLKAAEASLILK